MSGRKLGEAYITLLPGNDEFERAVNARLRQGMAQVDMDGEMMVISSDEAALNEGTPPAEDD